MNYIKYLISALLITVILFTVSGCIGCSRKNKPKQPSNFFSFMGDLISGKSGKKRSESLKVIQTKLDEQYPQLGLEVTAISSLANSGNMAFDLYAFAAFDSSDVRVQAAWNDYTEEILSDDFIADYQKAALHKSYADTLRANIPRSIPADIYYYININRKNDVETLYFYIFSPITPTAGNKDEIIRDIREALRLTTQQLGRQRYHASLGFSWQNEPRAENYRTTMREISDYYKTYLVAVLTSENEEIMPNFIPGGKAINEIEKTVEKQLFDTQDYRSTRFLLIRQDDFSEFFFIFAEDFARRDSIRLTTAVVETANLQLKEKHQIERTDSLAYFRYREVESMIPQRFRYQHIPTFEERTRSGINPFHEPHY